MLGKEETVQLLSEVLDHIAPLKLAMHQHIQPNLLLEANGPFDLLAQERVVIVL